MHSRFSTAAAEFIPAAHSQSNAFDLRQLQDFFFRRWKLILATAAIVSAVTFLALLAVTPRYTGTAQVLLDPRKEKIFGAENIIPELSLEAGNVDSQISVIRSINMLRRVVEKLKLTEDAEFSHARGGLFGFLTSWFASRPDRASPTQEIPPDVLTAIGRLQDALDVQRVHRTYVITISVTSVDPAKAAWLANAVADAYVVDQLDARYDAAKRASLWLAERMEGLRAQLRKSEEAVSAFRREHNLLTTTSETKLTINEQQMGELNSKLAAARAETAERRAKYEQVQHMEVRGGNLQTIPDVVRSPVIKELRTKQADLTRRVAELASRYNDNFPEVINARAELRDLERSISAEVARLITNLKNDFDVAKAREDSLQRSLDQISGGNELDSEVGIKLRELERINAANKSLFESFLTRANITQEQSGLQEREARLISPAVTPRSPSFPKKTLVLSLAFIAGILIGIGGSTALDMLNAGFSAPREIEERLGIAVLASIPLLREAERKIDGRVVEPAIYTIQKPLSHYAESIRAIRMGIQMSDVDHPAKVVMVTSTIPREGKSTVCMSLAFSALKANLRVVLIDADLRRPSTTAFFRLEKRPGLVDYLTGSVAIEQALVSNNGLTVIPAGSKSQNPPDLLASTRMKGLVEHLCESFDYVIIDTPPVAPVIDARVAMQLADKVLFVVRWQSTTRELVSQTLKELDADRKLAGVVLSCVDETKTPRYGPYSYYGAGSYKQYYQG
jgi:exopolysaccharide transport family protein